jgi:hypothetical protein
MRWWSVPLALALAATPWAASADENGIRVGDGRLHPYFEFETRYDSLVGYVGEENVAGGTTLTPYGDLGLHFRPGFTLEVPSERVELDVAAHLDLIQYLGAENEGTTEQNRVQAEADAAATFNPNGQVYFKVEDTFRRGDKTSMLVLGVGSITDYNLARVRVGIQPGSKTLVIEPGYSLAYEHFEHAEGTLAAGCADNDPTCDPDSVSAFDYLAHTFHLDATWKFLPKTAVVFDSSFSSRSYIGEIEGEDGVSKRPLEKYGTDNLRVMAGLAGLITPKLGLTLKAGWGEQLDDGGYSAPLGQAEAVYRFSERMEARAGYLRAFESHPGRSLHYSDDRVYGNVRLGFGEKLEVLGQAAYDSIAFGTGDNDRADDLVTLSIAPSYQITPWLEGAVGFALTDRTTSIDEENNSLIAYNRKEVFARVSATY